jgi:hypothetical protein
MQAGQWDLSRGHEVKLFFMVFVEIIGKLWLLTRPENRCGFDHERQILLRIALADMKVKHEGDQGPLQARPGSI